MELLALTPPAVSDLSGSLDRASRELRAAVIAADHARAERAVSDYVEAVRQVWEALSEEERATSQIPARTRELLAWAREMALIQRNLAADQYAALQKARHYHGAATVSGGLQVKG
jgi:phage/plasmid-associated DNA primase